MFCSNTNGFIQYSFLKNLFLSFLIVNFCFVVKLFFKAHRGILK
ncbi:membrane protein [Helicobacter pylori]|nr:membrane protein [Helicobacter pylori]